MPFGVGSLVRERLDRDDLAAITDRGYTHLIHPAVIFYLMCCDASHFSISSFLGFIIGTDFFCNGLASGAKNTAGFLLSFELLS